MEASEYSRLYRLESGCWLFRGRRMIIRSVLPNHRRPRHALDLGCGTGRWLCDLQRTADHVVGLDLSRTALDFCHRRTDSPLCQGTALRLPFRRETFDLATALDVCEHLDDDRAALAELARVTRPGGWIMLTVPAFPFLWSAHDRALWHRRRYTARVLGERVRAAGFTVHRLSYFNCFVFGAAALYRLARNAFGSRERAATDFDAVPAFLDPLLLAFSRLETCLLRRVNLPFGLSLLCLARKEPPRHAR
jgi:SAM-dependent methyltransferase